MKKAMVVVALLALIGVASAFLQISNGGGSGSGTVNSGTTNQVATYPGNGTTVGGVNALTKAQQYANTAYYDDTSPNFTNTVSSGGGFSSSGTPSLYGTPGTAPTGCAAASVGCIYVSSASVQGLTNIPAFVYNNANTMAAIPVLSYWDDDGIQNSTTAWGTSANITKGYGIQIPGVLKTTQITYAPSTADNTANVYDIGIYCESAVGCTSGTLMAHIGATAGTTFANTATTHTISWVASVTLYPGTYVIAWTSNCAASCASLQGSGQRFTFQNAAQPSAGGTTSGGALNSSVTLAADAWGIEASGAVTPFVVLR